MKSKLYGWELYPVVFTKKFGKEIPEFRIDYGSRFGSDRRLRNTGNKALTEPEIEYLIFLMEEGFLLGNSMPGIWIITALTKSAMQLPALTLIEARLFQVVKSYI